MQLIITKHAKQKMDMYGVTEEQVKTAIKRGSKFKQTNGLLSTYAYIRVAYKIIGEKYIIKTVMIED